MTTQELREDMMEYGWQWRNHHGVKVYSEANKIARRPDPRSEFEPYQGSDSSDSDIDTPMSPGPVKN
jgi:hypothetical protein